MATVLLIDTISRKHLNLFERAGQSMHAPAHSSRSMPMNNSLKNDFRNILPLLLLIITIIVFMFIYAFHVILGNGVHVN